MGVFMESVKFNYIMVITMMSNKNKHFETLIVCVHKILPNLSNIFKLKLNLNHN